MLSLTTAALLTVLLCILSHTANAFLILPFSPSSLDTTRALSSSVANRIASYINGPADEFRSPIASSTRPTEPLSFNLQSVRHHSAHPDYVGLSGSHTVPNQFSYQSYGNAENSRVFTKVQRVRRLKDPRTYTAQRSHIISLMRSKDQNGLTASSAVSTLESYHSLLEWEDVDLIVPDVTKRSTLLAMAKMSSSAYDAPPDPPTWEPGFEGWNLTESFGWVENGIRGHIFSNGPENEVIVVALKGTSASVLPGGDDTSRRDKTNDNLLFSCCCARVSWTWSPVCQCPFSSKTCSQPCLERSLLTESVYYPLITDLYNNISYAYPTSQIWVTGHSLGGALSSLIGMTFGVPSVTFEAPAERMAAKRLHLPLPPRMPKESEEDVPRLPITHVFHNADPIPMGTCVGASSLCGSAGYAMESKCHTGDVVLYNTTGLLGWHENIATHRIANLVDDLLSEDWGDRVRKRVRGEAEPHRSLISAMAPSSSLRSWWPWKGGKREGEEDDDDSWLDRIGEVPTLSDQRHCQDCDYWEFVDRDK